MAENKVYIAAGFHVNYNHSWRGDRNDRTGFGLDSQVIEGILDTLDTANESGLEARGTWDFDNYWSLEHCMPMFAPELLQRIQKRVIDGPDEVILDAWNNGLYGGMTEHEFRETLARTISNDAGSGIKDLFGNYSPVIRTQETMFTQGGIELMKEFGIDAIALYYSSIPFDSIRNFVRRLTPTEMYNPLWFNSTESDARLLMIPMYNQGDTLNHGSISKWARELHRRQEKGELDGNALIYINMDADADIWNGLPLPGVLKKIPNTRGLSEFIETVNKLDYVEFATLGDYIRDNAPVGDLTVSQDLADGSYTGYNSWTEKEENHRLWRIAERARRLAGIAEFATEKADVADDRRAAAQEELYDSPDSYFENKLRLLSTTHFGMHAPAVHSERAQAGFHYARNAFEKAMRQAEDAAGLLNGDAVPDADPLLFAFSILNQPKYNNAPAATSRANILARVHFGPLDKKCRPTDLELVAADGSPCAFDILNPVMDEAGNIVSGTLVFVNDASEHLASFALTVKKGEPPKDEIKVSKAGMSNSRIDLKLDDRGRIYSLKMDGKEFSSEQLLSLSALYRIDRNKKTFSPRTYKVKTVETGPKGRLGRLGLETQVVIFSKGKNYTIKAAYDIMLFDKLPYVFVDADVRFPDTPRGGGEKGLATGSEREFDTNWFEVAPAQIAPGIHNKPGSFLKVWKHNYMNKTNCYEFNYGEIHRGNRNVDACNNHITDGWVAVSNADRGFLLSCDAVVNSSAAYCPMRLRERGGRQHVFLNPFGTYHGEQFTHLNDGFNLAAYITTLVGAQLKSVAPSYNNRRVRINMMWAPYMGDEPPAQTATDADRFSMPPAVLLHEDGATKLYIDPVAAEELREAVEEYNLDQCRGWSYKDFLEERNRGLPKGVPPKDKSGDRFIHLIKGLFDGMKH